jgi:uncharacterized protein YndB with AHSA1/START domain
MTEPITVEVYVQAPIEKVWNDFTDPEAIKVWNAASDDWHTTKVENDLHVGGVFSYRMEAKDGSAGFDLVGTYTEVIPHERIAYTMGDGRKVVVVFEPDENGVRIIETFDPEAENTPEMQRAGWQAILDNFKRYIENNN